MSKLDELAQIGQSVWLDDIRRSFALSGELKRRIDKGLRGVTSNPFIFSRAIGGSADYDEDLNRLGDKNKSEKEIYEALVLKDIALAADLLRPVYEKTDGLDGYASLEVPLLAHDTAGTVYEAKRFFETLQRPNVMIKVPATPAGIPAIAELIGSGVNVNVTLLFSIENYKAVAAAYLKGLEKLSEKGRTVKGGHGVARVASVASFFISRVDTAVDRELEKIGNKDLRGKIAIANAKAAYIEFKDIFRGSRYKALAGKGARVQRLLWGSTGTKNPVYPDTLYVDQLIGPDTVNAMPHATLNSFLDHGTVSVSLPEGLEVAKSQLIELSDLGIDLKAITRKIQDQEVAAFSRPFESLMVSISEKRARMKAGKKTCSAQLGGFQASVENALKKIRDNQIINRIWRHDHTVWKTDPSEISNRLGWLHSPELMADSIPEIRDLAEEVRNAGYSRALLLGMGGSSLAPEMFRFAFGVDPGNMDLSILDSTDPGTVMECARKFKPAESLYIVSTKSGGTVETLSFMKYFYNHAADILGMENTGKHFIAITDPGSSLESLAKELKFRKIFLNDPNIGGRYSALSFFGLVPAGLIGIDLTALLERAAGIAVNCEGGNCPVAGDNTGAWLGAVIGELAKAGRDKLTLITSPAISHFGAWVEQLIAESTGKDGKGILPVNDEMLAAPGIYANDRLFVYLRLEEDGTHDSKIQSLAEAGFPVIQLNLRDLYDLGGEIFRWEMATAVAGYLLNINPFDQPNVESAKISARQMIDTYRKEGKLPEGSPTLQSKGISVYSEFASNSLGEALHHFLSQAEPGKNEAAGRGYVAIQAYLQPSPKTDEALRFFRTGIQTHYRLATTVGYGPRFLHSTGQLHKGDGGHGLFVQITADMTEDVAIPDRVGSRTSSISFGTLKMAQALGDRQALLDGGRKIIRFHLGKDVADGLKQLATLLTGAKR
jgi:transaldolase/glucose-6-phosphate isomerase